MWEVAPGGRWFLGANGTKPGFHEASSILAQSGSEPTLPAESPVTGWWEQTGPEREPQSSTRGYVADSGSSHTPKD